MIMAQPSLIGLVLLQVLEKRRCVVRSCVVVIQDLQQDIRNVTGTASWGGRGKQVTIRQGR